MVFIWQPQKEKLPVLGVRQVVIMWYRDTNQPYNRQLQEENRQLREELQRQDQELHQLQQQDQERRRQEQSWW